MVPRSIQELQKSEKLVIRLYFDIAIIGLGKQEISKLCLDSPTIFKLKILFWYSINNERLGRSIPMK